MTTIAARPPTRIKLRFVSRWTRRTATKIVYRRTAIRRHACNACIGEIRRGEEHWGGIGGCCSVCIDCPCAKVVGRA